MSRRSSFPFLFSVLALCSLAIQSKAGAQCETPILSIHVDSIFARYSGTEIDQRLGAETGRLQALFDYRSYRLLRSEEADTPCGQEVAFFLPVESVLHVRPLATHGKSVALDLALFAGARALLRTQLKVSKGGQLLLIGSRNPQEAYITALSVDIPETPAPATPLAGPSIGTTPIPSIKTPMTGR